VPTADGWQPFSVCRDLQEYINTDHSLDPANGCVMPALSADVSRAEPPVKDAYERKKTALVHRIASLLDGDDRQRRAWNIVALMVARSHELRFSSPIGLADKIIEAGRD